MKQPKHNFIDRTGMRYWELTVIERAADITTGKKTATAWLCRCDCGTVKVIRSTALTDRKGFTKSCGCRQIKNRHMNRRGEKHGKCGTRTWNSWSSMKGRCLNPNAEGYALYGGRGIKICDKWLSFQGFFEDMGDRPEGTTLERVDNNRDYSKENCRWATPKEQGRNRRSNRLVTALGKTLCITEWSEVLNIKRSLLESRLRHGWPIERAFFLPTKRRVTAETREGAIAAFQSEGG